MPVVSVGKPLREKLGDEAVESLVELINQSNSEQKNDILEFVEEKFERRLSEEIGSTKSELSSRISETKSELISKISETKSELITLISETKSELITLVSETKSELMTENSQTRAELIRWMFIFWVGQLGMILGILFAFFK